jgi:hypothetical protein
LWLTWGNAENLMMGHRVSLILPERDHVRHPLADHGRPRIPTLGHALAIGLCLFSLPLNGAPGLRRRRRSSCGACTRAGWRCDRENAAHGARDGR